MNNQKRILVTGGAGYIGSVLCRKLLDSGRKVTILDNFKYSDTGIRDFIDHTNLKVVNGDIRNEQAINASLENAEIVIHLAAISDAIKGNVHPNETREINSGSMHYLVERSIELKIKRFIFSSSFGVYGNNYNIPLTEDLEPNPAECYSETKVECENILKKYTTDNFSTTSLRIASVYGISPKMRYDLIVDKLVDAAINNNKLTILGGNQRRPLIHIDDLVDIILKLITIKSFNNFSGKVFNTGSINATILNIAVSIKDIINNLSIEMKPSRTIEHSFILNSNKLYEMLNFEHKVELVDGIRNLIMHSSKKD